MAEIVPGAYDIKMRAGSTATPGLSNVNLDFYLDRELTAQELEDVIRLVFETESTTFLHRVSIHQYTTAVEDGFACVDLTPAIVELGLPERMVFWMIPSDKVVTENNCGSLLAGEEPLRELLATR